MDKVKKLIVPSSTNDATVLDARTPPIFDRWVQEKRAGGDATIYTMYRWYIADYPNLAPFYTVVIEIIEDVI